MISRGALTKVFFNSFFIQSSWSFEKMQALGFAAAFYPAAVELYEGERRKKALERHLEFYNAHPYMASPILGAVINLEEKAARGEVAEDSGTRFRSAAMSAYSAIGDTFFWGALRPFASVLAALSAVFIGVAGAALFLVVFNVPHLFMRTVGLRRGYSLGPGVTNYIKSFDLPGHAAGLKKAAVAVLGAGSAVVLLEYLSDSVRRGGPSWPVLVLVPAAALSFFLAKRRITVAAQVYLIVGPLVATGVLAGFVYGWH